MDRNPPDIYLHRGAWLALDIAADGIFTTNNRNLQYSALEFALTVLQTDMTTQGKNNLVTTLQRLPPQDKSDILSKILKQKQLPSLPFSCLSTALETCGGLIKPPQDLIRNLEVLLLTNKQEYVLQALDIGFQHKINPQWLAQQLEKYWHFWTNKQIDFPLQHWWYKDQQHTQKILLALSLSEEQVSNLMDLLTPMYTRLKMVILDQLIKRSDLMPQLRISLWILYWQTHKPTEPMVTDFLAESRIWSKHQSLSKFLEINYDRLWPLLAHALESQLNNDQYTIDLLRPYLNITEEISFSQQITTALRKGLKRLPEDEQIITVLCHNYTGDYFSELVSLAEKLGIDNYKLTVMYTTISISGPLKLSSTILQGIFSHIEKNIAHSERPQIRWWTLLNSQWKLDYETINQGVQLLYRLSTSLPEQPIILNTAIVLFLKLLSFNNAPLFCAPTILSSLVEKTPLGGMLSLIDILSDISEERLTLLANFTTHEDPKIQQGALILWTNILDDRGSFTSSQQSPKLKALSFDWSLCLSLIKNTNIAQRKNGIVLLTYSHFPIREIHHSETLQNALALAQDSDEIAAWARFLSNVPVSRPEKKAWQKLLETLLDAPQSYNTQILTAAMERYTKLEGIVGPEIKNERILDLPVLTLPKKKRGKK